MALVTTGAFKHSIPYVYKSSFDGFVVPYLAGTAPVMQDVYFAYHGVVNTR